MATCTIHSGDICSKSGEFIASCGHTKLHSVRWDVFPYCPICYRSVEYLPKPGEGNRAAKPRRMFGLNRH